MIQLQDGLFDPVRNSLLFELHRCNHGHLTEENMSLTVSSKKKKQTVIFSLHVTEKADSFKADIMLSSMLR